MIEKVEQKDGMTIYWFEKNKNEKLDIKVGIIINRPQSCVTDEIATGYDLSYEMLGKVVSKLEKDNLTK